MNGSSPQTNGVPRLSASDEVTAAKQFLLETTRQPSEPSGPGFLETHPTECASAALVAGLLVGHSAILRRLVRIGGKLYVQKKLVKVLKGMI